MDTKAPTAAKAAPKTASIVVPLPAGWRQIDGKAYPLTTPRGLLARGGILRGRCDTGECRRRVNIDLGAWIAEGHGDRELDALVLDYRCGRSGCGLRFDPEYFPRGLPLQSYVAGEERIEVRCASCTRLHTMTAEKLIASLVRRGIGTGNIGIVELATRIGLPCRACGKQNWQVTLRRPPASGTPGSKH